MKNKQHHIETRLIHAGEPRPAICGAVSLPIFQSSTYEYAGQDNYDDLRYIRLNNTPNHLALHEKLASLENAEDAVVMGSGMAAISTLFFALLKPGDHFLAQDCLYGGTHEFLVRDFSGLGISFDFIKGDDPSEWEQKLKPETRLIYVETITNPLMQVADLKGMVEFAQKHNLVSVIDNTFASPVNFRPAEWGFDLSVHSGTKYLNGHSDIVAGAVMGRRDLIKQILHKLNHLGGTLDPHACFLLHRGLKTLAVRMRYQNESALKIAKFFKNHSRVTQVNYPGLPDSPSYTLAGELLDGCGGMLSFEIKGGVAEADAFIQKTTLPFVAPSLGGVETLITRPATTSHAGVPQKERMKQGITDHLIRLSVGIENTDDLITDFEQALG